MDWPTLIKTLKDIMEKENITAGALAKMLGVSVSSVHNYLSLRQRASIMTREKLESFVAEQQKKTQATGTKKQGKQSAAKKPAKKAAAKKEAASTVDNDAKETKQSKSTRKPRQNKKASASQNDHAKQEATAKQQESTATTRNTQQTKKQTESKQAEKPERAKRVRGAKSVKQQAGGTASSKQSKPVAAKKTVAGAQNAKTANTVTESKSTEKTAQTDHKSATQNNRRNSQSAKQQVVGSKSEQPVSASQQAEKPVATSQQSQPQATTTNAPIASRSKTPARRPATNAAVRIYVDESFGQGPEKPFTVGMVLCGTTPGIMPFKEFTNTLYPFGWAPGDEVKAQGKDLSNVKYVLEGSVNADIKLVAFRTKMVPPMLSITDDDSTMVSIFPYVSALITAIERMRKQGMTGSQYQIVIDRTNKLPAESLRIVQNLLDVYFRLAVDSPMSFHVTDGDSRAQKGLQLADFVSHYAYVQRPELTVDFEPVTTVLDDEMSNARRFAYYSGLRVVQLRSGAQTIVTTQTATEPIADEDEPEAVPVSGEVHHEDLGRAMELALAFKDAIVKTTAAGLSGKQLEAVRSRLKGLSTTIVNWLDESQAKLLNGLANRSIADFRERLAIITRIDKPFKSNQEIGEQQFRIFETQLDRILTLLDSYSTTAEKN